MKIPQLKNNTNSYLNTLIAIVILTIPFYAQRIPLINTSLSILTLGMLLLSVMLFTFYHKSIITILKKEFLLWLFALLFVVSLIPSLVLYPTIHSGGVFLEWILFPALTSFLLYTYTRTSSHAFITIQNTLTLTLFIISIISIIYFILDIKTFDGRLSAFYPSPNHLALFIAPLIPITIAQFLTSKHTLFKALSILTLLLSTLVLFFTNSFISSVSVIVTLIFITFVHTKKKRLFILPLLLFFILISVVGFHKITSIELNPTHNPFFSRTEIWTVATHHIQNNPLLSTGPIDTFQQVYLEAQPLYTPYNTWSSPTPHNLILTLWISGGFFTVLFFCLLCSRWLYLTFNSYKKTKNATILLYTAAFLTILLTSLFDTPFWKNDLSFLFWIIIIFGMHQTFEQI